MLAKSIGIAVNGMFGAGLIGAIVIALAVQLVPYGRDHTNPPVLAEPRWDGPQTRALAVRACFDCHSNATVWPWYSNVAPISWMVQRDVDEGRRKLNFSEMGRGEQEADEAAEEVERGKMPPAPYLSLHPEAALAGAERQALIKGLAATLGEDSDERGRDREQRGRDGEDDKGRGGDEGERRGGKEDERQGTHGR